MTEEIKENPNSETGKKPEEPETSQNKDDEQSDDSNLSIEELRAKNRQLYERAKKAEQRAKLEEAEKLSIEKDVKKSMKETTGQIPSTAEVVKQVAALKDFSADEVDYIFKQAEFLGVTPQEAVKNEDVSLFIEAKREKIKNSQATPEPSSKQAPYTKDVSQWSNEDLDKAAQAGDWDKIDEFRKWAKTRK